MDGHIEAVQRMQDYIAMHIDSNITMADLANVSQYSTWYSYRLFMDLLHMTPAVYIRRLRLSKSALRLRDEKVKIIDVAFDTGYERVWTVISEHFTKSLDVILMNIPYVLHQFICSSLMESNMLKKRRRQK